MRVWQIANTVLCSTDRRHAQHGCIVIWMRDERGDIPVPVEREITQEAWDQRTMTSLEVPETSWLGPALRGKTTFGMPRVPELIPGFEQVAEAPTAR